MKTSLLLILLVSLGWTARDMQSMNCALRHEFAVAYRQGTTENTQLADESILSICIEENGSCEWVLQGNSLANGQFKQFLSYPESRFLLAALRYCVRDPYLNPDWLTTEQPNGTTALKNGVQSIRLRGPEKGQTIVLLLDEANHKILGCSVYRDEQWLERKLVLDYHRPDPSGQLLSAAITLFDNQSGQPVATETVATFRRK